MPPGFGFGVEAKSKRFGGSGGGIMDVIDSFSGNNLQGYLKSEEPMLLLGQGVKEVEAGANPESLLKLKTKLMSYGMNPKAIDDLVDGTVGQFEQARLTRERKNVLSEISPTPARETTTQAPTVDPKQFGMGSALSLGEEADEPGTVTEYSPGSPGRAPNQSDFLRMAGRKAFDSLSGSDDFLTIPQKQFALGQQGEASAATADLRKTERNIKRLEEMETENLPTKHDPSYRPSPRALAANPELRSFLPMQGGRQPSEAGNRIFQAVMEVTGGDTDAATEARVAYERRIAAARGGGTQEGALGVRQTPGYLQNQTDVQSAREAGKPLEASVQKEITGLEGALRQVENIEKNLDPAFLGPIRGRDFTFEARRQVGGAVGRPLPDAETNFRQSLKDVQDQLLRARSGAAISPGEFDRLTSILPKATDEPEVFSAGLARFKTELTKAIQSKAKLGVTPRNQIGGPAGPKALPKVLKIEPVP